MCSLLPSACLAAVATALTLPLPAPAMNAPSPLLPVLPAPAPHPSVADKLAPFAPLIGSWDVDIVYHSPDGDRRVAGEWHFDWALEGRALVDVWIAPARPQRSGPMPVSGEWGMTVRFYDPSIDAWRSTWLGPKHHVVMPFIGRLVNGEIVLEGSFEPAVVSRWIFSDLTANTFRWRAVSSRDNWKTETLTQEMFARRRPDPETTAPAAAAAPSVSAPRELAVITAPSPLGLRPPAPGRVPGARRMPTALIAAGLLEDLTVAQRTNLAEPAYEPETDPATGIRNLPGLIGFTRELEGAVATALRAGRVPLVIGGDCSVLLGPAVALRRLGRHALVHLDGHSDFSHEGNTGHPYASIAGADLAVVTGRGPHGLTELDGLGPYFKDEDVFQLGEKDDTSTPDLARTAVHRFPLSQVRAQGIAATLELLRAGLDSAPVDGFWLHIDLDVLDSALLPAVDSPEPTGFTWEELDATLAALLAHPKFVGLNIGIYDPDLDPDGSHARRIATLLRRHLAGLSAR